MTCTKYSVFHSRLIPLSTSLHLPLPLSDLDSNVPDICRKATAEMFLVWRRIISLKTTVMSSLESNHQRDSTSLPDITSTLTAVDKFESVFQPTMKACLENFQMLSAQSRMFSGSFSPFHSFTKNKATKNSANSHPFFQLSW